MPKHGQKRAPKVRVVELVQSEVPKQGYYQITSRNSTDVSDYGIYDTSSLEKDITVVVSVQFGMK